MKLRNMAVSSQCASRNDANVAASASLSRPGQSAARLSSKRATRAGRDGVPMNRSRSNRPGRTMAESNAFRRFVAIRNTDRSARRRSLICVNMAVVSTRDSMPMPGVFRSKQNSSISSKRMTTRSSFFSRSKT